MPNRKASLTDIAREVNLSVMSVSNALSGRGRVSPQTRARVLGAAKRLGYVPDPLLAHLMHHVRTRRTRQTQANLGFFRLVGDDYEARLLAGVRERARQLGYAVDYLNIDSLARTAAGLTRVLKARGITGLLLPPVPAPRSMADLVDWNEFSTVAMTNSIHHPRFNRVVPHHLHNAMLVFSQLRRLGYRRPLLVMARHIDERANHAYSAAVAWDIAHNRSEQVSSFVPADTVSLQGLREWCARHAPDSLVIGGSMHQLQELRQQLGERRMSQLGIAVMDHRDREPFAGIDQKVSLLGFAAVGILDAQLLRAERGFPQTVVASMIEGAWVDGSSCPKPGDGR